MKRLQKLSFVTVVTLVLSLGLNAQTSSSAATTTTKSGQVFTEQDKEKAKQDLKNLGQIFGVQQTHTSASTATSTAEKKDGDTSPAPTDSHKTMGDVADRALSMVSDLVGSVYSKLQQVAPEIWRIFVLQQYAKAVSMLVVPWTLVILALVYMRIANKAWTLDEAEQKKELFNSDGPTAKGWKSIFARTVPLTITFLLVWWGVDRLSDAVLLLINPHYYAVRDLLQMLLNPSQGLQ